MPCKNHHVLDWIEETRLRLEPADVRWICGSEQEWREICQSLVDDGTFIELNSELYPNSFWCRSNPTDVARVEDRTFICSATQEDAGPTNNWMSPGEMYDLLAERMQGCMKGRTLYVVPYLMGPAASPYSKVGFELTDSPYVVANMYVMARIGDEALLRLGESPDFVRGVHSVGTLDPGGRYIAHFPEDNAIISFNSNYGGNALQGKKCFALRIASSLGRSEGWLAEHMLIVGITNPRGEKHYICAAFPSACGKTNLAMLVPPPGYEDWKVETVGDDIAWLNFGSDGRLYAINPEAGFFGVAPGTNSKTNPNALAAASANTIFTNTGLDLDRLVPWWEGLGEKPSRLRDWLGNEVIASSTGKVAHPNSRFTAPARQCPSIDANWESAGGVPISAIVFGGRRPGTIPLVLEATSWQHGVFLGVTMASETTAAAAGKVGELRRDPMAMLPFIGYHAGDYFTHWLEMGMKDGAQLPKIFHVNWFRSDENGNYLWPGFGDNIRVLEWILNRVAGRAEGRETPLGVQPLRDELNIRGTSVTPDILDSLLRVDPHDWKVEISSQREFFRKIGDRMPEVLWQEHSDLKSRLGL